MEGTCKIQRSQYNFHENSDSSRMLRHVDWWVDTDVSKDRAAFVSPSGVDWLTLKVKTLDCIKTPVNIYHWKGPNILENFSVQGDVLKYDTTGLLFACASLWLISSNIIYFCYIPNPWKYYSSRQFWGSVAVELRSSTQQICLLFGSSRVESRPKSGCLTDASSTGHERSLN